jgi:dTDP-4-amino-4,6-dideoxygalactose transaminase
MSGMIPMLDLGREHVRIADELQRVWSETLRTMHLLDGPQQRSFEREIAAYLGVPHARGVGSGTDALILGLAALGVGRGDRVILPANAFVAALEAIHFLGAQPELVDVEAAGFGPDLAAIERALPAKAVLIVHLYGAPLDLTELSGLCRATNALLIEDGSHAHGASRGGRYAGSVGAVGCFSAGVVKNLGAFGDAGFVTTSREDVADKVALLRNHGRLGKHSHRLYGMNSRLDELQAGVLRLKLRHLAARNQRRREIARFYDERFAPLGLRVPCVDHDEVPVYHQYVVRSDRRDDLATHLEGLGVQTAIHYPVPLHRQAAWSRTYGPAPSLPRCEKLAREILSLPIFPDLTDAEVEYVARAVEAFHRGSAPTSGRSAPNWRIPDRAGFLALNDECES